MKNVFNNFVVVLYAFDKEHEHETRYGAADGGLLQKLSKHQSRKSVHCFLFYISLKFYLTISILYNFSVPVSPFDQYELVMTEVLGHQAKVVQARMSSRKA